MENLSDNENKLYVIKEKPLMQPKSDNKEIVTEFDTGEIIGELFHSLLQRHQVGIEQSNKSSKLLFDYVDRLFYRCHKISLNCGRSRLDSLNG